MYVDPGSPTGQEYAVPLDEARRESADSGGERNARRPPPLFGEGVSPKRDRIRPTDRESAPPTNRKRRPADRRKPSRTREGNVGPARPSRPQRSPAVEPAAGSPSVTWTSGVPALVLAAGVALGLGARRFGGRP